MGHGQSRSSAGERNTVDPQAVSRLVAYLCSSDRAAGAHEADEVAEAALREAAAGRSGRTALSSAEVHLFACAERIAADRADDRWPERRDALRESAPADWDRADLARLTVVQDVLDQLPTLLRHSVLLREMCGFTAVESADILGARADAVESARSDGLRTLVSMVEPRLPTVHAAPGALTPDDFIRLGTLLQAGHQHRAAGHGTVSRPAAAAPAAPSADPVGWATGGWLTGPSAPVPAAPAAAPAASAASWSTGLVPAVPAAPAAPVGQASTGRPSWDLDDVPQRPAARPAPWLTGDAAAVPPAPAPGPAPSWQTDEWQAPWRSASSTGSWTTGQTALDMPLSAVDMTSVGTPIFDAISAWFATGPEASVGNVWASMDDDGWQAASAKALADPQISNDTVNGLPRRPRGANMVPSMEAVTRASRNPFGDPQPSDPGAVRDRLGGLQQALNSARASRPGFDDASAPAAPAPAAPTPASGLPAAANPVPPRPVMADAPDVFAAPTRPGVRDAFGGSDAFGASDTFGGADTFGGSGTSGGAGLFGGPSPFAASPAFDPADTFGGPDTTGAARSSAAAAFGRSRGGQRTGGTPRPAAGTPAAGAPRPAAPRPLADDTFAPRQTGSDDEYVDFYRENLPQLLALMMVEGSGPQRAADLAQQAMDEARRTWDDLDDPWDWVCQRALSLLHAG